MIATDNCGGTVNITISDTNDTASNDCAGGGAIIRTYTATDACGNQATATQRIVIFDEVAPVFVNAPADITVTCDDIPTAENLRATDECDTDINITFGESVNAGSCTNNYVLVRTWRATDACGNTTCLLYTSPSPRDKRQSRMPSSA